MEEVEDVEEGELEEEEEVVKGRAQLTATAPLRILFALSRRIIFFSKNEQTHNSLSIKVGFLSVCLLPAGRLRLLGRRRRKSARWKMRIRRRLPSH